MRWAETIVHVGILVGKPEGKRWEDDTEMDLREIGWTRLIWLRIGTSGGLLWSKWWTFWFHKMLGNSRVAEGLSSVELDIRV
jgi:hypothetical protein